MLLQKLLDLSGRSVHLTLHITCTVISAVIEDSLIMYKAVRIQFTEFLRHIKRNFSAERLVSDRPDQDCRMILVSLITGVDTIEHHRLPVHIVAWNHGILRHQSVVGGIPGTVRFQIVFRDHVQTVFVAQFIDSRCIRIMAGSDRVDVIALHRQNVGKHFVL